MYKLPYTGAEIEERLAKLDNLNAENFLLSEETADLYGLSGVDANVDKALEINSITTKISKSTVIYTLGGSNGNISFTNVDIDDIGAFNLATNPTRITIPGGVNRVRLDGLADGIQSGGTARLGLSLFKNGSQVPQTLVRNEGGNLSFGLGATTHYIFNVVEGDYFSLNLNSTAFILNRAVLMVSVLK